MSVEALVERAAAQVEKFARSSGRFQAACDEIFKQLDYKGMGRVGTADAVAASGMFFDELSDALVSFGLDVKRPSDGEVRRLLADQGLAQSNQLNRDQFDTLYMSVLKLAAGKCVRSFARKYGTGMLVGTVGLFAAKRVVRGIPIVGLLASPLLILLPTLIVGPVVGVAGVYALDHGGLGVLGHCGLGVLGSLLRKAKDSIGSRGGGGGGGGGGFISG